MEFLGVDNFIQAILEEYPCLKQEDIYACIQFTAKNPLSYGRGGEIQSPCAFGRGI
jgi:uncharacterized protein (DUF433 family)